MKIIIAGSRNITSYELVEKSIIESGFIVTEIVSGAARGVDQLGEQYGMIYNIPVMKFPADWNKHGKSAGPIRNIEMGKYADALIAIWDGQSKGTKHMIDYMKSQNKPTHIFIVKERL
jgi:hypothetical protein